MKEALSISADSSAKVLKPILIENFLCFRCFGKFSLSHLESLAERTEHELCAVTLNAPRCRLRQRVTTCMHVTCCKLLPLCSELAISWHHLAGKFLDPPAQPCSGVRF